MVKEFRWYIQTFWYKARVWRTDGRTDGIAVAYTALSIASRGKKNLGLQSTAENWQWWQCPNWFRQTVPNRRCSCWEGTVAYRVRGATISGGGLLEERSRRRALRSETRWRSDAGAQVAGCRAMNDWYTSTGSQIMDHPFWNSKPVEPRDSERLKTLSNTSTCSSNRCVGIGSVAHCL